MIHTKIVDAMRLLYNKNILLYLMEILVLNQKIRIIYITAGSVKNNMNEEQIIKVYFNNNDTTNNLIYAPTQQAIKRNKFTFLFTNK